MRRSILPGAALAVSLAGCGSPSPPSTPAPPPSTETITGRERLGWRQPAADTTELSLFSYALYVDGTRNVLDPVACDSAPSAGAFGCSSALPPLAPGRHTLQLATFFVAGDESIESGRSAALEVVVAAAAAPAAAAPVLDGAAFLTGDGVRLTAAVLADDLDDPSDLAIGLDGRIFIAERAGKIRVADGTQTTDAFALAGVAADEQGGLTTIAIDPRFERTRFVYVVYTAEERDGPVFRVVRLREAGGRLGEPAVIRQEPAPPSGATAVARFGPDQRLYVGASAGRDAHDARTAAAALGTILRLNDDGTTPRDNPRPSPVFSTGHRNPQGLAWHPAARTLWMVDRHGAAGDEVNLIAAGADYGWPPTRGSSVYPGVAAAAFSLPGVESSGAAFGPAGTPLEGDLLVGAAAGQDLLRLRVDANGARVLAMESLLDGRFGRVGAVASVPGAIYFITVNRDGRDRLVRLTVK